MRRAANTREGKERRVARRYVLDLPVKVGRPTDQVWDGIAKDVSINGLYLIINTDEILPLGTILNFSMTLPCEVTGNSQVRVSGRAKAVRIERFRDEEFDCLGVASTIESYDFVRFEETDAEYHAEVTSRAV
jgi:PilZ domain